MEMLPVWAILLVPLITAFVIALFLQNHDRAAAAAAITSISLVLGLTLYLPFATINEGQPGYSASLERVLDVEGNPTNQAYIYRETHRAERADADHGGEHGPTVTGWRILPQKSVINWAAVGARKDGDKFLPLGAPPMLEERGLTIEFGVMVDNLAFFMLFVVGFIGLLVHIFSVGYLAHEGAWGRYFAGLQLFCFSMLGIVISPNYLQTFIFWELVGVSSYVLIGHYYQELTPPEASKKAFMTNRVADFGFMIGILLLFFHTGTVDFARLGELAGKMPELFAFDGGGLGTVIGVLLFVGCMGKSAQFPFHIWLPDAMAGPTPVSALMHAATMVAAGVYLVIRSYPVYNGEALRVIAWVGVLTAVLSALMAVIQNDIKKVLAYSTLSQLGYMMMVLGLGGYAQVAMEHYPESVTSITLFKSQCYTAGMFHLTTHAFFKALLFLASGAVIVGMHHHQDMREMGGLFYRMPWTGACFLMGTLALAGVWPFAGFWSKDLILHLAHQGNHTLYFLASGAAFLTAFYMGRSFLLTFLGEARSKHAEHAHEVDGSMVVPLVLLAILSFIAGILGQYGIPGFEDVEMHARPFSYLVYFQAPWHPHLDTTIAVLSNLVGFVAFLIAFLIYGVGVISPDWYTAVPGLSTAYTVIENKFYCDDIALFLVKKVQDTLAAVLNLIEQGLLIGLGIYGFVSLFRKAGGAMRHYQTGNVRAYASLMVLATLAVLFLVGAPLIRYGG